MARKATLTVFYDGACPLCDREIAFYRRWCGNQAVSWVDVRGVKDDEVAPGLSRNWALARFHVMRPDGTTESGGAAFAELWSMLPGLRPLSGLVRSRPLKWLLDRAYNLFLVVRPRLQAMAVRRETRKARHAPERLVYIGWGGACGRGFRGEAHPAMNGRVRVGGNAAASHHGRIGETAMEPISSGSRAVRCDSDAQHRSLVEG
jgi:predicted DCC family thiol-disulfide oxidoreductase YuxK